MTTMLDKCAVAGDISQAIDRRGAWAVAITVIGGTDSTAVKLQSAETADGSFTDFKTLIASSEASTEQYKGFVVDLHGAKQFIKVVGATMATAVLGDCEADVKKVAIKTGEIPSGADLEDNKSATIDVSTYTEPVEITPTAGKDGMKKATVTLSNIPSGGATAYAWYCEEQGIVKYTDFNTAPLTEQELKNSLGLSINVSNRSAFVLSGNQMFAFDGLYTRVSDTKFTTFDTEDEETLTYTRDSTKDFSLWETV